MGRTVLITKQILAQYGDAVIAASFCKQMRTKTVSPYFLYLFINELYEKNLMQTFEVQSTGISNFQFSDFLKFQQIIIPPDDLMTEFHSIVEKIYAQISVLGTQSTQLRHLRDRLLPRLMSGELDVSHLEIN